ncbi:MAG: hypothetical protein JSS63_03745 [Bacteroidetes bacterium]|nr:hypothetical protein [Bacteroidota bacterium]
MPPCLTNENNWIALSTGTGLFTSSATDGVTVRGFLNYGDKIIVFGRFETARNNGLDVANTRHIAVWDGTKFEALIPVQLNWHLGACIFTACFFNGRLYIGGSHENLARVEGTQWKYLSGWNASGYAQINNGLHGRCNSGSEDGEVCALESYKGFLYIGGTFTYLGNNSIASSLTLVNGLIRLKPSDILEPFTSGAKGNFGSAGDCPGVFALKAFGNELYVGGKFEKFNGINSNLLIKYDGNVLWTPSYFTNVSGNSPSVTDFMIKGGILYMAGDFKTLYSGTGSLTNDVNHIAYLGTGNMWYAVKSNTTSLTYGVTPLGMINKMTDYNGDIVVVGPVYTIGTVTGYKGIARLSTCDCNSLPTWYKLNSVGIPNNASSNASVGNALISFQGNLYVGGSFSVSNGASGNQLMYWRKCN